MMSSRSGDLDPGVLLHLLADGSYDTGSLATLLERQSGLLGVTGSSGDMKTLLDREPHDPRAALAIEMFCYQARKTLGGFVAALGGLDSLVFTGGIGERSAEVRARICGGLEPMGISVDPTKNAAGAEVISPAGSACSVRVVKNRRRTRDCASHLRGHCDVGPGAWRRRSARRMIAGDHDCPSRNSPSCWARSIWLLVRRILRCVPDGQPACECIATRRHVTVQDGAGWKCRALGSATTTDSGHLVPNS